MKTRSNWTPVIVSDPADRIERTDGETKVSEVDGSIPEPAFSALNVTYLDDADESSDTSKVSDRKIQSQADLRFAVWVAFALFVPVLIALSVYIAMTALLRAS
jgi:hypothetical protein